MSAVVGKVCRHSVGGVPIVRSESGVGRCASRPHGIHAVVATRPVDGYATATVTSHTVTATRTQHPNGSGGPQPNIIVTIGIDACAIGAIATDSVTFRTPAKNACRIGAVVRYSSNTDAINFRIFHPETVV